MVTLLTGLIVTQTTSASTLVKGTFVDVTYEEVPVDNEQTEKRLASITIKNTEGRMTTLRMDSTAVLSINGLLVSINAFKTGMEVEADVQFRRVSELRGTSAATPGAINSREKVVTGTVNQVDKSGKYLSLRLDQGQERTYYLNEKTEIFKGTNLSDLSVLFEGDRVKLTFSEYDTNFIDSIEVNEQGTHIQGLYKGTIQQIDPINRKIILKNQKMFLNWLWQPLQANSISSYTYSSKIPIYVGDQQIDRDRLRHYANHEVYVVTVNQFGKEIIEKMVIKRTNERTFYESMRAVNSAVKWVELTNAGKLRYHDGTILIRNGRIVDSKSLYASGTAFVVTDGVTKSQYANVVHVSNDGFQSPNLANHQLYYGKVYATSPYKVMLSHAKVLSNNYWQNVSAPLLTFSNDTTVVEDSRNSVLKVLPSENEVSDRVGQYGYFYVANGHIRALHIIGKDLPATLVSVGRVESVQRFNPAVISVRNVSQWQQESWRETGSISSMNIEQATIIKAGKIISPKDLQVGDRLYLLHESHVKGRVLLVD